MTRATPKLAPLSLNKSAAAYWSGLGFAAEGFQVRSPIQLKIRRALGLMHFKSYIGVKRPPTSVVRRFGEGVPDQVSSSSSDRDSKLRGPFQNSTRVSSKRDVNITKNKASLNFCTIQAGGGLATNYYSMCNRLHT
ncbi:hypothetical protein AVEN_53994-1 [Araneus ventricosus]|uniref:Uncharacterized protein n=1 Tax=Araneus ventricosus TaxID=182803 RepID=A0A4Y2NS78_ARAVE|nr:hypothetical protein AVEN_46622-1 [Araneus ventricosus]GBN41230.1 hypothetical protein AVEN_53994-1 [Araneus ventricosus]